MVSIVSLLLLLPTWMMGQSSVWRQTDVQRSGEDPAILHVYLPEAEKCTGRAVMACPGGGYGHLSMQNEGSDWAEYFCSRGIVYAVLEYRMPKGHPEIPVGDACWGIRTLRDSAMVWHVNPYDVGIMGFSAGGHLASTVSTQAAYDERPNFSILFYPVVTMGTKGQHEGSCKSFLGDRRGDEDMQKRYSSDRQVRAHLTPPAIILLANNDRGVPPVANGIAYYTAMRNRGNDCALHVYPQGGHGFGMRETFPCHDQMLGDLSVWLDHLKAPQPDDIRVACIGNSITDGSGIDMCDTEGYPALLQRKLGTGYNVRNYGVSARCVLEKSDHPYTHELAWRDALAFCPDIVVVKLGTNDSKDANWKYKADFAHDYQVMIDSLKALPSKPRIILAYPATACKSTWTINDQVITGEIIPAIDALAKRNKLETLDLHSVVNSMELMQGDGIHPNAKGVEAMAEAVRNKIQKITP